MCRFASFQKATVGSKGSKIENIFCILIVHCALIFIVHC